MNANSSSKQHQVISKNHKVILCNNCQKPGHLQHQCKMPIVSVGMIVFRFNRAKNETEYLMICRKDTLGFVDFMRGKYYAQNKHYILNMIYQMTVNEKQKLQNWTFDALWRDLWHGDVDITGSKHLRNDSQSNVINVRKACGQGTRRNEENLVRERFENLVYGVRSKEGTFNVQSLLNESASYPSFLVPEWVSLI